MADLRDTVKFRQTVERDSVISIKQLTRVEIEELWQMTRAEQIRQLLVEDPRSFSFDGSRSRIRG